MNHAFPQVGNKWKPTTNKILSPKTNKQKTKKKNQKNKKKKKKNHTVILGTERYKCIA